MDLDPQTPGNVTTQKVEKVDNQTVSTSVPAPTQKKLKPVHLIITAIVGIILLCMIGFSIWYFAIHNNPDKVALDAINSIVTSDNVSFDGEIQIMPSESDGSALRWITVKFDSSSQRLPNATNVHLELALTDQQFDFDLGTVQMQDGVVYLRVSGIMAMTEETVSDEVYEEMAELFELIDLIDGEWWRISISDISDYLGFGETGEHYERLYACSVQLFETDKSRELRSLYRDNKFITITKDTSNIPYDAGTTAYLAKISSSKLADFVNGLFETQFAEDYYECYNAVMSDLYQKDYIALPWGGGFSPDGLDAPTLSAADFNELDATDIEQFLPDDLEVGLVVDNWSHALQALSFNFTESDYQVSGIFYPKHQKATVFEPADYRPITDLFDELRLWGQELLEDALNGDVAIL